MAWLPGYLYRKSLPITGGSDGALTDYQLKLAIAFVTDHMQSDFDDIRFTKEDGETRIDAWLEEKTDGTSADVWVEFPSTPADGVTETKGYVYYGKSDAVNYWDIDATFLFGDDFPGTSLDTSKWETLGVTTPVSDGAVCLNDGGGSNNVGIYSKTYNHPAEEVIIEWKGKVTDSHDSQRGVGSRGDSSYIYKGTGGLGYYSSGKYIKVYDYSGSSATTTATIDLDTWYRMRTELQPDKIKATRLDDDISAEIANTLASHHIGVYAGYPMCLDFIAVRKYAANPPTYTFGSEENAPSGLTILDFERAAMRGAFRGIMRGVA